MTLMKEKAVEMIRCMPEDSMLYVINILQNLEAVATEQKKDRQRAKEALANILDMEKRLSDDFDAEKELHEARVEKFENLT